MFATDWSEDIPPDEEARFAELTRTVVELQRRRSAQAGAGRALHRKQHAGVEATLTIRDDLPETLRVGPFAAPRTFAAYVRFSNAGGHHGPDREPDLRGLGLKVCGVDGPKVLGDARTQDFLFINRRVQPFRDPEEFVGFLKAADGNPATLPLRVLGAFGFGGFGLLKRLLSATGGKIDSLATIPWWSGAAIRWGATAVRYRLQPVEPAAAPPARGDDQYRADLAARLRAGPIRYDLEVQGYVDAKTTPIEDATVEWPSPHVPVARLEIPAQDLDSQAGRALDARVEGMAFDPWHAVEELRPLGAVMRARKQAYFASYQERGGSPEPD